MKKLILVLCLCFSFTLFAECPVVIEELVKVSEQIGSLRSDESFEDDIATKQHLFYLRQQLTLTQYELKREVLENCSLYKAK